MSFLNSMNISASAMTAQRMRLDIASENLANVDTTRTEAGGPYRRKVVVFQEQEHGFKSALMNARNNNQINTSRGGVKVVSILDDPSDFKPVYNPSHPDANAEGYVMMPNVDELKETVDSMSASRSYEANVTALNSIKQMAVKALEIGR